MKKIKVSNRFSLRAALAVAALLALSAASAAQIKLRNAVDYDGDMKADIGVFRQSDNGWYISKSNGTGAISQAFGSLHTDTLATGDYDADGKTDFAAIRNNGSTLDWYIRLSQTGSLHYANFGAADTDSPVQNDYDGDNKADIAVWRDTSSTFYILRSTDNVVQQTQWGFSTDSPIAAYDTH